MRLFQSNQQEIINIVFDDFSLFWVLTLDKFLLINFCMKNYIDILKVSQSTTLKIMHSKQLHAPSQQ